MLALLGLLTCGLVLAGVHAAAARATESPLGAHSMLQLNDPPSFMKTMFARAAAMHASAIRLDVQPSIVFSDPLEPPDFSGLDEVVALSEQYHLPVVADLLSIPGWIAACPVTAQLSEMTRCAPADLTEYQSILAQIVARAAPVITDWEVWNEPDNSAFFSGTPQQYAQMLRAAYDTIKQVEPQASVLLGGISGVSGMSWLAQVFATPGADAAQAFDIANVHERNRLSELAPDISAWKQFFAKYGFTGPLWVTEHGYPSDSAYQYDPQYDSGPESQATFLTASVPTLLDAGAQMVFVTERDNLGGQFASEGMLGGDVLDPPVADPLLIEKPAYDALAQLAACYVALGRDCPGPAPVASPVALTVPSTAPGTSRVATVSIVNPGSEPLRLGQASLAGVSLPSGSASSELMLEGDKCSATLLEPRQSCTAAVRFTPVAGGATSATLELASDDGTLAVPVSAVAPSVSSLTASMFGLAATGSSSRAGPIQGSVIALRNPLSVSVHIARPSLSSPLAREFAVTADRCLNVRLAPGAGCRLIVRFTPVRHHSARVTVTFRGSGLPLKLTLREAGTRLTVAR